ncbi:MAG TPA: DsrE family protein [Gammaproteobacteria bacterium]|nr:DsrE family protein [Gammaproteobacteria bacterium]
MNFSRYSSVLLIFAIAFSLLSACEKDENVTAGSPATVTASAEPEPVRRELSETTIPQRQFNIGNKRYLFDISDHTIEEMESLLSRAREISELNMDDYSDLEIVMIIHGPDIDWFTRKNLERNHRLIDLAAKLDAFDIIDMKVCKKTMDNRGVKREEIPAFIESVPYAPDEIKRLNEAGYINL